MYQKLTFSITWTKIWFINGDDNINWPLYRDWKADISSVSPSSDWNRHLLWQRANTWNLSFSISVRWSIYIINSVDKPNFRVSLPHRRSTTVSSETNPHYLNKSWLGWFTINITDLQDPSQMLGRDLEDLEVQFNSKFL